jgi:hypothetical protein
MPRVPDKPKRPGPAPMPNSREGRIAARVAHLWATYRISEEMWFAMYEFQGRRCMYCHQRGNDLGAKADYPGREKPPLVPDHEHVPPYRWRGLGHGNCNRIAGVIERALADPPGLREDCPVKHQIPVKLQEQIERRTRMNRESQRRRRKEGPLAREAPGERTTYRYPDPESTVASALLELEEAGGG